MKFKFLLIFIGFLFMFNLINAQTYCNRVSPIEISFNRTESVNPISMICTNQIENTSVTITSLGSYLSISPSTPITIQNNPQTLILNPDNSAPVGDFTNYISFSDGSSPIQVNLHVKENIVEDHSACNLDVFPTTLSNIKLTVGEVKSRNVQISVPNCYESYVKINGVVLQTDQRPINLGELSLGNILPGNSAIIPIELNAKDVQTGQYNDVLSLLVYDKDGKKINVPSVSISVFVMASLGPSTNDTFSTPPTCSLSSSSLNLNSSYSFSCSNVANIDIDIPSNDCYVGKKVDITGNIYKYEFTPTRACQTKFKADFKYKGASIFTPFSQDITISSMSSIFSSNILRFIFTPSLSSATSTDPVLIQIVENTTGSLVTNPKLYINALEVNPLNNSPNTFSYKFNSDQDYELRAVVDSFNNLVQTIRISPKNLDITASPTSGDHNTYFNITGSDNCTLKINGNAVNNPFYSTLSPGVNTIEASKTGYITKSINISVTDYTRITDPIGLNLLEKKQYVITLSKSVDWMVYYSKKLESGDKLNFANGTGTQVTFTPKNPGFYSVSSSGLYQTYELKGFSFTDKWLFMKAWIWIVIIGGIILFVIIFVIARRGNSKDDTGGMVYNTGD